MVSSEFFCGKNGFKYFIGLRCGEKKIKLSKLFRYVESFEETKYRLFQTKDKELFKNIMKYGVTLVALSTKVLIKN